MKKRVLAALLAAAMVFGLVACGGSKTTETKAAETEASGEIEACTINFKYWADNTDYSALMQDIIAKFNEENEYGITVVGEEIPWDGGGYTNTLFNEMMGGGNTDVATFKLTGTPMFVNNGLLADLTGMIDAWEDKDDISENLYNVMRAAGGSDSIYVMPWNVQVLYVYYRPSIFEEAGVEVPTTYAELLEVIEKCTIDRDGDGKADVYGWGMRGSSGGQEPWGSFIHAAGGSFDDLTSDASVAGMQDFIDLYANGFTPATATGDGFQETVANFKSGLTAMFIHHIGSSKGMVEELGEDVDAFIFPAGEGQWTSLGDTETVMAEACENKAAAFEWMKYLAAYEGQQMWCEGTGQVPVSKTVQATEYFQNDKFQKVSASGMDVAGIIPVLDTTTEFVSNWKDIIAQALVGDITAAECMQKLNDILYQ